MTTPVASTGDTIRLLVVDDHQVFAESLARAVDYESDMVVCGVAGGVSEAVLATRHGSPDVILLDYALADGDAVEAAARIRAVDDAVRIVILTGATDAASLRRLEALGCAGILAKTDGLDAVMAAIRGAHAGSSVVSPAVDALLALSSGQGLLTDRDLEILQLVAEGLSNRQISEQLFLSLNTVRNYVQRTLEKLGAHSKLEAASRALSEGLVRLPDSAPTVTA